MKTYLFFYIVLILSIGCSKFPDLGGGYKLDYDGKYTLSIVDSNNTLLINETILDYAYDSTFIIVSQRPWNLPGIVDMKSMNYNESMEVFEKSTYKQYWIIDKRTDDIYGPFKWDEYMKKRKELGVPKELKLK